MVEEIKISVKPGYSFQYIVTATKGRYSDDIYCWTKLGARIAIWRLKRRMNFYGEK